MAAPTERGTTVPAAGLSRSSPAGTQIGDLVIVFTWERAGAGVPTHTLQTDYVFLLEHSHDDGSTDGRLSVTAKVATASGAQTYQGVTSSVGTETWTGIRVLTAGTWSLDGFQASGLSVTNNAAPDPPNVTLSSSRDWIVFAIGCWHHSASATITPTAMANYGSLIEVAGSSTGDIAIATRALTAPSSENPAQWTDNIAPNGSVGATVAIGSQTTRTGTATPTQGADTASTDVDVAIAATATPTQGADTASTDADVAVAAVATPTQSADTMSGAAAVSDPAATGILTANQSADTVSAAATVAIAATATSAQGADTCSGTATVDITASASLTQGAQTSTTSATVALAASSSATQGADTATTAAAVSLAATTSTSQGDDTASASSAVTIAGSTNTTQGADSTTAASAVQLAASAQPTQAGDSLSANATVGGIPVLAELASTQGDDTCTGTALVRSPISVAVGSRPTSVTVDTATSAVTVSRGRAAATVNATSEVTVHTTTSRVEVE